ncbi:Uncharacterized conserved protein YbjQ, UPF0145 family [Fulvimarina manganoxydans]|uniref:UPF0145 protein SAMN06297251_101281 n=1 Tax=Fulvimarina manganoxydans TaxID=937218 RepID=A0A1W1YGB2_9HYPH|nr:heavy metal-binding domain-containing protein [Fulvimarina manganoxydans]SMC35207.1 Uncharacterized conserved protein YbjQ, UPF0145 family [Fulvimarina manganoxydans]
MIVSTTPTLEGRRIVAYHGVVTGEAILGTNVFRDFFASIRDIVGGRSGSYEASLREGRELALGEMAEEARRLGGNAVVGVDLDYENITSGNNSSSMLMVVASGTAVTVE